MRERERERERDQNRKKNGLVSFHFHRNVQKDHLLSYHGICFTVCITHSHRVCIYAQSALALAYIMVGYLISLVNLLRTFLFISIHFVSFHFCYYVAILYSATASDNYWKFSFFFACSFFFVLFIWIVVVIASEFSACVCA